MPRITCPTCGAALDVADDMIGETVECGSCRAHFVAEPPRAPGGGPTELVCPRCGDTIAFEKGSVKPNALVRCGSCNHTFEAWAGLIDEAARRVADRPGRRRVHDEDDRPSRRRQRDEDDDEDDYDRPRRRRRTASESGTGMATASLVLGILSLPLSFCCSLLALPMCVLGIIFGVLGMKTEGRGMAITGLVLSGLGIVLTIAFFILGMALNLANIGGGRNNFGPGPNNNPPPWQQPKPPAPPQPPRNR